MTDEAPRRSFLRTLAVIGAAVIAIGTPIAQFSAAFGLSASQFSSTGDSTLRAAGYAFAIWGLIYLGLALYALYQAIAPRAASQLLQRFGWPSAIAMVGCGAWLLAAAANWPWVTVAIIVISALALIIPLLSGRVISSVWNIVFIVAPLGMLAGWLTIASALNTLTVLTAQGYITHDAAPLWAAYGVAAVIALAFIVFLRARTVFYLAPIIWGLGGVYAAEHAHRPLASQLAVAGIVFLSACAILHLWTSRRRAQTEN